MLSVGLPNHASEIGWLAMESLCRQKTTCKWELIVYEDSDIYLGGKDFYESYRDRLKKAGCVDIKYEYRFLRIPLSLKWLEMAQIASPESIGLILQASDCYSEPNRIQTTYEALKHGFNWIQSTCGYFYNFKTKQFMLFNSPNGSGLNMAIGMNELKEIESKELWSGVDYWLKNSIKCLKPYFDISDNWMNGIDTDGHNRISLDRKKKYNNPKPPFFKADVNIREILPEEICDRF